MPTYSRKMRTKKKVDYGSISRRSVRKYFYAEEIHIPKEKVTEKRNLPKITMPEVPTERAYRIQAINPACQYAKYAKFFIGKLVKQVERTGMLDSTTGWYEFVFDDDRKALNEAAGWSDMKKRYLLERPKLK